MRVLAVVMTTTLLLAACGAPAPASVPSGASRTVRIDMSDFFFSPTTVNLDPGETVTLMLKNFGTLEHEFMAGRDAIYGQGYDDDWLTRSSLRSDLRTVERSRTSGRPAKPGSVLRAKRRQARDTLPSTWIDDQGGPPCPPPPTFSTST